MSTNYVTRVISQLIIGPGVGRDGGDQFFMLTPEFSDHQVRMITRRPLTKAGFSLSTLTAIDRGSGDEKGQILTPVALAFDRQRVRLLVLETQGRLQVFDVRPDVEQRYITQWGQFGGEEGEFQISSSINAAVIVDSRGMIYVADGARRIQVFAP